MGEGYQDPVTSLTTGLQDFAEWRIPVKAGRYQMCREFNENKNI